MGRRSDERRRRRAIVARWRAQRPASGPPALEIPDERMRRCPECGAALTAKSLWHLSGESPLTLWYATCPGCGAFFECDSPPPDGAPVWRRNDDPPEFLLDWDGFLRRHGLA